MIRYKTTSMTTLHDRIKKTTPMATLHLQAHVSFYKDAYSLYF